MVNTPTNTAYDSEEEARNRAREALMPPSTLTDEQLGGSWDTFVLLMRRFLPFIAAGLAIVTIGWPLVNDREVSFTLSKEEVAPSDGTIKMTNLRYTGTDAIDRKFVVEASSGFQDTPTSPRIRLSDIHAEMDITEGNPASMDARTGIYRVEENSLSLVGGVSFETANGYSLEMAGAEIDMQTKIASGQGSIRGEIPLGTLEAGRFEIRVDERTGIFADGVSITITPKRD